MQQIIFASNNHFCQFGFWFLGGSIKLRLTRMNADTLIVYSCCTERNIIMEGSDQVYAWLKINWRLEYKIFRVITWHYNYAIHSTNCINCRNTGPVAGSWITYLRERRYKTHIGSGISSSLWFDVEFVRQSSNQFWSSCEAIMNVG